MKKRTQGILTNDKIDHDGEVFNYIQELHQYLWDFVRTVFPGASGDLEEFVDNALETAKIRSTDRELLWGIILLLHPKTEGAPQDYIGDGSLGNVYEEIKTLVYGSQMTDLVGKRKIDQMVMDYMLDNSLRDCTFERNYRRRRRILRVSVDVAEEEEQDGSED